MTALLDVSPLALLGLWSELEQAYYGVNGYGGNTAEIYAHRFQQLGPTFYLMPRGDHGELHAWAREAAQKSARALHDLLVLFAEKRGAAISVDGQPLGPWLAEFVFDHRVHVLVERSKK